MGSGEPRGAAGRAAAAAPALDGLPEQGSGGPNLPRKPRVCISIRRASAHAALPRSGNEAKPPHLGLGPALGDEDGDEWPSGKGTGLHRVLLTLEEGAWQGRAQRVPRGGRQCHGSPGNAMMEGTGMWLCPGYSPLYSESGAAC